KLQNLWRENKNKDLPVIKRSFKEIRTHKQKLAFSYLRGAIILFLLGLGFLIFGNGGSSLKIDRPILKFLISGLVLIEGGFYWVYYAKIKRISQTEPPKICLKQWVEFNLYRKKFIKPNIFIFGILFVVGFYIYWFLNVDHIFSLKTILFF